MYSSSARGRKPRFVLRVLVDASARDDAIAHRISSLSAALSACSKVGALAERQRRVDGLLGQRPMIAQVLKRGEQIGTEALARRVRHRHRRTGRNRELGEPILELEHHALGGFAPDARNGRQPREIAAMNGGDQLARLDAGQHRDRQLRPDAADGNQPFKNLLLERA